MRAMLLIALSLAGAGLAGGATTASDVAGVSQTHAAIVTQTHA